MSCSQSGIVRCSQQSMRRAHPRSVPASATAHPPNAAASGNCVARSYFLVRARLLHRPRNRLLSSRREFDVRISSIRQHFAFQCVYSCILRLIRVSSPVCRLNPQGLLPPMGQCSSGHNADLHRHPRLPPQPHCHARQCGRVWCQQGICSAFGSDCCRCDCGASSRGPQSFSSSTRQAALSVACCSRPLRQQR